MSMPTIPEEPHRPSKEQVIQDLLKSVALEENALAHLMNVEAEKLRRLLEASATLSLTQQSTVLGQHAEQTIKLMDMIIMKEWLLLRKICHTLEYNGTTASGGTSSGSSSGSFVDPGLGGSSRSFSDPISGSSGSSNSPSSSSGSSSSSNSPSSSSSSSNSPSGSSSSSSSGSLIDPASSLGDPSAADPSSGNWWKEESKRHRGSGWGSGPVVGFDHDKEDEHYDGDLEDEEE